MTWLIVGGAGYIGSHIVDLFLESGQNVVVFDNLTSGKLEKVAGRCEFINGDITKKSDVVKAFEKHFYEGVINLAALKSVEESTLIPNQYWEINSRGVQILLSEAINKRVPFFIQSSTAAVYGNTESGFADETTQTMPISVYGETKLHAEQTLSAAISNNLIRGTSLRYFNVVGAKSPNLRDTFATNLFPIAMKAIRSKSNLIVYGRDYDTHDGTCIRDYLHVEDLARAHLLTVKKLREGQVSQHLNIGTGVGLSVLEVISALQDFNGTNLPISFLPRRQGDVAAMVAKVNLARDEIGFVTKNGITQMVESTFT
jgi:UDP-glucose 4-epimerase